MSFNNEHVDSSSKTAILIKESNVYIAACLYMINEKIHVFLCPSYNIPFTADFDTEVIPEVRHNLTIVTLTVP